MFKFILVSLSLVLKAHAFVQSASIGATAVNSDSSYQDSKEKSLLEFRPNVTTGTTVSLETKYVAVGYVFAGKVAREKNQEKSRFQDLRFNFNLSHFDFRLSLQAYKGALVNEGNKKFFYRDYEVKSANGRIHYYFNSKHLESIRPSQSLIRQASENAGFRASGSWLLGLTADDRRIHLPETLEPEHQSILTNRGIIYTSKFDALSWGPLLGYDGLIEFHSLFLRLKVALGSAFQSTGGTTRQSEIAFLIGMAFAKNHMLSVGVDIFTMSFKDTNKYINNTNSQINFLYSYAF